MNPPNEVQAVPTAAGLPEHCFALHPTEPWIIVIWRGLHGFYRVTSLENLVEQSCWPGLVQSINAAMGILPPQVKAMLAGSMFSWDCPGANPQEPSNLKATWEELNQTLTFRSRHAA